LRGKGGKFPRRGLKRGDVVIDTQGDCKWPVCACAIGHSTKDQKRGRGIVKKGKRRRKKVMGKGNKGGDLHGSRRAKWQLEH